MMGYEVIVDMHDLNSTNGSSTQQPHADEQVTSFLVLGGGTAGLLAALSLQIKMPNCEVRVVRSPELGIIGVGEGTTAAFPRHLFENLRLDGTEFYQQAGPTWKLGIRFLWGNRPRFYYTFGNELIVQPPNLSRPVGYYFEDDTTHVGPLSALCEAGNAFTADEHGNPQLHNFYAFHIENRSLASWLEQSCQQRGIHIDDATIAEVATDDRGVSELVADDGRRFAADLYIDASGFRSELLGKAMGVGYKRFDDSLFCDRAVIGGWDRTTEPLLPYTTSETMDAGWCWQIEHEHYINRGYVYSSDHISDEQAEEEFRAKNPKAGDSRIVKFFSGRRESLWVKNVVGLGNAAGFVEPLEATAIQAIVTQITGVTDMLQDSGGRVHRLLRESYNRFMLAMWDDIRDFLAVHYKFNHRSDTEFWRRCQNETSLDGAEAFCAMYREVGPAIRTLKTLLSPNNAFGLEGYLAMMIGMDVPYQNRHQPTRGEREVWKKSLGQFRQRAEAGVSVNAGLEIVRQSVSSS